MHVLVNIDVSDVAVATRFYSSALSLRHARTLFDGAVAEMLGADMRIYLVQQTAGSWATPAQIVKRDFHRHWTPVHLDFIVTDIKAALRRALDAGAVQETAIRDFPWGRLVTLSDPFGNGFCLIEQHGPLYEAAD